MNRKHVQAGSLLAVLIVAVAPRLQGQAAPTPTAAAAAEETVVLSPFVVEGTEDADSYAAKATLAGNRIRTDLRDVGSSISVVTQKFLSDTNSRSAEDLLVYTVSTEVAGQGGNFLGQGDGAVLTDSSRNAPIQNTRVRGLAEADNTRDFFLSDIPWDSYNVGRVDLQRGPNSILFGIGSPAGIVNSSLNTATFKDANKIEVQFGSFGSSRAVLDINKVLIEDQLAVRFAAVRDDTKYRQRPAFEEDERFFGAVKWDTRWFDAVGPTSIRVNFEKGSIEANRPRSTPPLDAITPWFFLGKPTFDARTVNTVINAMPSPVHRQWYGALGNRVWDGVVTAFDGGSQGLSFATQISKFPDRNINVPVTAGHGDNVFRGIRTYDAYANALYGTFNPNGPTDPATLLAGGGSIGAYKAKSLVDRDVFDFYTNLLEGPNKREFNDFKALNVAVSQQFGRHAGVELVYDRQNASWGHDSLISGDGAVISVDIINTALDGSPNPNVGRPLTLSNGFGGGTYRSERLRENVRATGFYELDFSEKSESNLSRILGRHVFTGVLARDERESTVVSAKRFFLSQQYTPNNDKAVNNAARDNIFLNYLGPDLRGSTFGSARGLDLRGIGGTINPQPSTVNVYNNVSNVWERVPLVTINNDLNSTENITQPGDAFKNSNEVTSSAVVWQGFLLDRTVVPMVGFRKDKETAKRKDAAADGNGGRLLTDPDWDLDDVTGNSESGDSLTYSLALHLPESLRDKMPGRLGVSLYANKSENFQPDAGRRDILGDAIPSPVGETEEFGVAFQAFDDKVTLRLTKYETEVTDATLSSQGIGAQYLIGAVEAWGQASASRFRDSVAPGGPLAGNANTLYGIASSGHQVTWRPAGPLMGNAMTGFTYTQQQLDATSARQRASIDAWYATQVPAAFQSAWQLDNYNAYAGITNFGASGLVVTGDTLSEGYEFELIASNLTPGLDIAFNAAKTSASRNNPAKAYVDWITQRWEEFQGPAGDMRLWGPADDGSFDSFHDGETARGKYQRETIAGYNLFRALEGADVPELRPWRFNVIANYSFQSEGVLKGANIGGSFRWQDSSVTGFPLKVNDAGDGLAFDVDNPYKGAVEAVTDFWVGYQRRINEKFRWRVQLNVRNLFANDNLIPVTVQPDGSAAAYRIPEPRVWTISNTLEF